MAKSKPNAYDKALSLLACREHSRKELQQKLSRNGYASEEASAALNRLSEQHYQDDVRFAQALIKNRLLQGYGPLRLRAELKSHGLSDPQIGDLLDAVHIDWVASAVAQLRRRYGSHGAADPAERARRAHFLLRRGFSAATVREVTRVDVDNASEETL